LIQKKASLLPKATEMINNNNVEIVVSRWGKRGREGRVMKNWAGLGISDNGD